MLWRLEEGGVRELLWARAVIIWVHNTTATAWTHSPSPVPQHPETSSGGFRAEGWMGIFWWPREEIYGYVTP